MTDQHPAWAPLPDDPDAPASTGGPVGDVGGLDRLAGISPATRSGLDGLLVRPTPAPAVVDADDEGEGPGRQVPDGVRVVGAAVVVLLAVVCACVAIGVTAPVLGHGWQLTAWSALAVVGVVAAPVVRRLVGPGRAWPFAIGATLVVATFTVGAAASVVVDGRVLPVSSPAAQVLSWSRPFAEDLRATFAVDALLELPDAQARARRGEYQVAVGQMRQVSARWADGGDAPDPRLDGLAARLSTGAHHAAEALVRREQLLTSPDSVLASQMASNRTAYITEVLPLGPELAAIAGSYGVDVVDGPTE